MRWHREPRKIREDNPGDNIIALSRDNRDNIIRLIICFALSPGLSDYRQHGRVTAREAVTAWPCPCARMAYNERTDQG